MFLSRIAKYAAGKQKLNKNGNRLDTCTLIFPVPHFDGEVFTTELFKREFAEVPDAFDIDVVSALDDGLVVGAFPVDVVGRVEIHYLRLSWRRNNSSCWQISMAG